MSVFVGSLITFSTLFTNSSGVGTDPAAIRFILRENLDGTELLWTYNAVPVAGTDYPVGMNPLARTAAGAYNVPWIARKPELQVGLFIGSGTVFQVFQYNRFVRHTDIATIEA